MVFVLDNYDSFTYNLVQYMGELGAEMVIRRNDEITPQEIEALRPAKILISPGPCTPQDAGISIALIQHFASAGVATKVPILGVCLGHQAIGAAFGGTVERARRPLHGQATPIDHRGERLFSGLPAPMPVGRYHSLVVTPGAEMDRHLSVDAVSQEGEVMALSHRTHPTYGIQFHPESVLTEGGHALFANFLDLARAWRERPEERRDAVA